MKTIHVAVCIPIYHRDQKVVDCCTESLDIRTKSEAYQLDVTIAIGVNGASESLKTYLEGLKEPLEARGYHYCLYQPPFNLGKPKMVNRLVEDVVAGGPVDYVVSMDSDMVVKDHDWLLKFVEILENAHLDMSIGALSANQTGECCHLLDEDPVIRTYKKYHLIGRIGNNGIAGGLLVVPYTVWEKIGGYRSHRKYASDDGHLCLDCANNELIVCMVKEIYAYHPKEDDTGYIEWKQRAVRDQLSGDEKIGYYKDCPNIQIKRKIQMGGTPLYDRINIFCPTYKRIINGRFIKMLTSAMLTAADPKQVCFTFLINDDDQESHNFFKTQEIIPSEFLYHAIVTNIFPPSLSKFYNTMYEKTNFQEPGTLVSMIGDDMVFKTKGWDDAILRKANEMDGVCGIYCDDDYCQHGNLCVNLFTTRKLIEATGKKFMCEMFPVDFIDTLWMKFLQRIRRAYYLDWVKIKHEHACHTQVWNRLRNFYHESHANIPKLEPYVMEMVKSVIEKGLLQPPVKR